MGTLRAGCVLLLAVGCASSARPEIGRLDRVAPGVVERGTVDEISLLGEGFKRRVSVDLDAPEQAQTRGYRLVLSGSANVFNLEQVRWLSEFELKATLPADAPAGTYEARLFDGWDRPVDGTAVLMIAERKCRSAVDCADGDECTADSCDDGVCAHEVSKGASCDDGDACTGGSVCDAEGVCGGGLFVCAGLAPRGCLTVSATAGTPSTVFTFDASCSTGGTGALSARFDFEGDGIFDTAFGPLTASATYPAVGYYNPAVELRDTADVHALAATMVAVVSPQDQIVVTTAEDENSGGATPSSPSGSGLSLREAIAYVNSLGLPKTITFASAMTIELDGVLPQLSVNGAAIWGQPGVVLDFKGTSSSDGPCLIADGANNKLGWLRLKSCGAHAIAMKGANGQVAYCTFDGASTGHSAKFSLDGRFGPGNVVRNFTGSAAFQAKSSGLLIDGNAFSGNDVDIEVLTGSSATKIRFNTFVDTSDTAIEIPQQCPATDVTFNTFIRVPVAVEATSASSTSISALNNIFERVGCGLSGQRGAFAQVGPNLTHPATSQSCFESEVGSNALVADPRFVDAASGDLRLRPDSAAVNGGRDVGLDTNGVLPGNFNGSAPDFGANESPY